ncbi:MAG: ribonuclease HII, partial [Peptoniphilaceae bacterium]|nr:ribonuclease HII [Peptoniphilaceae bacterium]
MRELKSRIDATDLVCGVDEVGRGPLAGPVVACAIIMPKGERIEGVRDSKKVSEIKREKLYDQILEHCIAWGIGQSSEQFIDEINIRQATLR